MIPDPHAPLIRAVTGPMWHGPALVELLQDVGHEEAAARPIPGAHSIAELVLHVAAWAEIAAARLRGEALGTPDAEQDWPPIGDWGPAAWTAARARLARSHEALAAAAAAIGAEAWRANLPGLDHSAGVMIRGVVEHACYHGGQIALLKRARGPG